MGFAPLTDAYPWDSLAPYIAKAKAHPHGAIDLSVGAPVDPSVASAQRALIEAANSPGYPTTAGTVELRQAIVDWFARRRAVPGLTVDAVLPTVGSKEAVGLLPSLLGIGPGDVVVHPRIAYPTYDVGIRLAGATALASDDPAQWAGRSDVKLVWVNSPGNPHGKVATVEELREVVAAAREIGAVVVSDECYAELAWDDPYRTGGVPSALDPVVTGGDPTGVLVAYSLSKQSNLAGYRAALLAGDPALIAELLRLRKHLGLIVAGPVQAAMTAALGDDAAVEAQRSRYARRRERLLGALQARGYQIDHSEAGLYLWVRSPAGGDWDAVAAFAERGIIVGPGSFWGPDGAGHIRIALTASDEAIDEAAARLGDD